MTNYKKISKQTRALLDKQSWNYRNKTITWAHEVVIHNWSHKMIDQKVSVPRVPGVGEIKLFVNEN